MKRRSTIDLSLLLYYLIFSDTYKGSRSRPHRFGTLAGYHSSQAFLHRIVLGCKNTLSTATIGTRRCSVPCSVRERRTSATIFMNVIKFGLGYLSCPRLLPPIQFLMIQLILVMSGIPLPKHRSCETKAPRVNKISRLDATAS